VLIGPGQSTDARTGRRSPQLAGDYMIEVDEPSVDSRRVSHQRSFDWASEALPIAPH